MGIGALHLGHPEIDAQHEAILHLVGEVRRAVEGHDAEAARHAVEALWNASVSHFATEEALMDQYAYPERNPHRTAHHLFLEDLKALLAAIAEHGLEGDVGVWAVKRMPDWVAFHVETNDAPLARFLARKAAAHVLGAGADVGSGSPPRGRWDA